MNIVTSTSAYNPIFLPNPRPSESFESINKLRTAYEKNEFDIPLSGSAEFDFFESKIRENVYRKNTFERGKIIAREVRGLIKSLSSEHQKKFKDIVESIEKDKDMIGGIIWGGGALRVVAEIPITILISKIFELTGKAYGNNEKDLEAERLKLLDKTNGILTEPVNGKLNLLKLFGSSAGTFPMLGFASRERMHMAILASGNTDFEQFHMSPETAQRWINERLVKSVSEALGENVSEVKQEHFIRLGYNPQVKVGIKKKGFHLPKTAFFPEQLKSDYGIDPSSVSYEFLSFAAHNMYPIYMNSFLDYVKDCGNANLVNEIGEIYDLIDGGLFHKWNVPTEELKKEISHYLETGEKPKFYFVIKNQRGNEKEFPKTTFGAKTTLRKKMFYKVLMNGTEFFDKIFIGTVSNELKKLGAERACFTSYSEAPDLKSDKKIVLHTAGFSTSVQDREIVIGANFPTKEFADLKLGFKSAIDQLHENLVDKSGRNLSFYELWLNDINKKFNINDDSNIISRNAFDARKKLHDAVKEISKAAAAY